MHHSIGRHAQTPGAIECTSRLRSIQNREACVGVIGLGYVGLPLALAFAKVGFDVTGFDVDERRVTDIGAGRSYLPDVAADELRDAVGCGKLSATTDLESLGDIDVIDICVPTPLRKTRDPDLSFVVQALEAVAKHVRSGQLVVLESTTYPGTTDEIARPILEAGGLEAGPDFYLAFSPERVDPANRTFTTRNIPKVVGGIDPLSTEMAVALYGQVVDQVVPVSCTRVAEMVKLLENTFRAVNIGLVNEVALMCHKLDIDVWETIDAAATKPFGFMPFYPGPGLGGHCIPVDPFYLSWKARQNGFEARFIELAGHVNSSMPAFVVERVGRRTELGPRVDQRGTRPPVRGRLQTERRRCPRVARPRHHGVADPPRCRRVLHGPVCPLARQLLREPEVGPRSHGDKRDGGLRRDLHESLGLRLRPHGRTIPSDRRHT